MRTVLIALVLLTAGCEASPEVQKLCGKYVAHQEKVGRTGGDAALKKCLRLEATQIRCLMKATGRRQRISCTQ